MDNWDRVSDDGFYGFDDRDNGTTDWYDADGTFDCSTATPWDD